MKKLINITNITGDFIPYPDGEQCYSGKQLKQFTYDMFADMILDCCDHKGELVKDSNKLTNNYELKYLDHIPKTFARVYLYGVWEVIRDCIKMNKN
jgi:hypothetical protein